MLQVIVIQSACVFYKMYIVTASENILSDGCDDLGDRAFSFPILMP